MPSSFDIARTTRKQLGSRGIILEQSRTLSKGFSCTRKFQHPSRESIVVLAQNPQVQRMVERGKPLCCRFRHRCLSRRSERNSTFPRTRFVSLSFFSLSALGVIEDQEQGRDSFPPRNILRPFLDVFPLIHLLSALPCTRCSVFMSRVSPSYIKFSIFGRI